MLTRRLSIVLAVAVSVLAPLGASVASAAAASNAARFIVTLADGADSRAVAAEYRRDGASIDYVYGAALNGFAGSMSDANLRALAADRRAVRVERDGIATASIEQSPATWGLDRIDQPSRPTDGKYTFAHDGAGVNAYIVDTGINYSHVDFGGRATKGYDAFGGTGADCNGHGTHVAGTVAGSTWGVAKAAPLVAVRVLDCNGSGSWSGVIAGLDWIAVNGKKPAVANMSLGGGASSSVDDAVNRTIDAGIPVVVAAGNGNKEGVAQDACGYSPARVPNAVTIGATTDADAKTSWSNYGNCVDFFAPGASITSAWHTSTTATNTISGTSMAAPHAAGVAALYLQQAPSATPATVSSALAAATTKGIVTSSSTTNNHLLYSLVLAEATKTGTVSGVVTGTDGTAIQAATVASSGSTATTGSDGTYNLTLPVGAHTVTASAAGFDPASVDVNISESATTAANFTLSPTESVTITLTLTKGAKVKNVTPVTATWTDTTATFGQSYDVWANGSVRATVTGTTHTMKWRGSGTVTYRVCRAGSTSCSADVSITI